MKITFDNKKAILDQAEAFLRAGELNQARDLLEKLHRDDENDNEVLFDYGTLSLLEADFETADHYFDQCLKNGYERGKVYHNAAIAKEKLGNIAKAEKYFSKACEDSSDERETEYLISLFNFYIRIHNIDSADDVSRRYIEMFSQEYQGHHMLYLACVHKKEYSKAEDHFIEIRDTFEEDPNYWLDRLYCLFLDGKFSIILEMIDNEPIIMQTNPNDALRIKIRILLMRKNYAKAEECINKLFDLSKTADTIFFMMLLEISKENYVSANKMANNIIKMEVSNPGFFYYLTLYMQSSILYLGFNRKLPDDILEYIVDALNICVGWFVDFCNSRSDMEDLLDEIKSTLSFYEEMQEQRRNKE